MRHGIGALMTAWFFHYARLRLWMEGSERKDRWQWYLWLTVWGVVAVQML